MLSAKIKIGSKHFMEILQEETLNRTRVEEEIYTLSMQIHQLLYTEDATFITCFAILERINLQPCHLPPLFP